ncbi:MAG: hypothetical protein HY046_13270 [Acidobacteria bacterium]|nr:hypothetical protein [Acidobacteriota bacterium]
MAHTFLVFDFGTNEEAAQQARHKIEGWQQGFRLGKKLLAKFERTAPEGKEGKDGKESIRVLIRLEFSDHEKLSRQRWEDRIPSEEPFKEAAPMTVHQGDATFEKTVEQFESLT